MALFTRTRARAAGTTRREDAVFEFSRKLVGAAGVAEIGQALFRAIDDLFGIDRGVLLEVDESEERAWGAASMGEDGAAKVSAIAIDLAENSSAVARVVRDRVPHRILDVGNERLHDAQVASIIGR